MFVMSRCRGLGGGVVIGMGLLGQAQSMSLGGVVVALERAFHCATPSNHDARTLNGPTRSVHTAGPGTFGHSYCQAWSYSPCALGVLTARQQGSALAFCVRVYTWFK